jgi:2-keto-4-pentenoate hydratase
VLVCAVGRALEPRLEPFSEREVWKHVREVVLCLELCGRRHTISDPGLSNLVGLADCSSAGGVVLGGRIAAAMLEPSLLPAIQTQLLVNGQVKASGSGAASPFGSPLASLTWFVMNVCMYVHAVGAGIMSCDSRICARRCRCANHLSARGRGLAAADLVIAGSTCKSPEFSAGDVVVATFGHLGDAHTCLLGSGAGGTSGCHAQVAMHRFGSMTVQCMAEMFDY